MVLLNKTDSIQRLRSQIAGRVLTADDSDYEQTRRAWNLID